MDESAQNRAASCAAAARPAARDPHCADRVRQATALSAQARASRVSVASNREKTTTLASQGERSCLCACTRRARSSRTADSTRAPAVPCRGSDRIRLVRGAQPPPGGRAADRGGLQWVMRKPPAFRSRVPHVPPPSIGAQQRARCAAQRPVRADWSMRVESLAAQNTSEYAWPQGGRGWGCQTPEGRSQAPGGMGGSEGCQAPHPRPRLKKKRGSISWARIPPPRLRLEKKRTETEQEMHLPHPIATAPAPQNTKKRKSGSPASAPVPSGPAVASHRHGPGSKEAPEASPSYLPRTMAAPSHTAGFWSSHPPTEPTEPKPTQGTGWTEPTKSTEVPSARGSSAGAGVGGEAAAGGAAAAGGEAAAGGAAGGWPVAAGRPSLAAPPPVSALPPRHTAPPPPPVSPAAARPPPAVATSATSALRLPRTSQGSAEAEGSGAAVGGGGGGGGVRVRQACEGGKG
eukprot:scaffold14270_cov81-Isochrysis_galbana.AAC.2